MTNFYRTTIKTTRVFLKQLLEMAIAEADKGNRTVGMKRDEYEGKIQRLIDDDDTYLTLNPKSNGGVPVTHQQLLQTPQITFWLDNCSTQNKICSTTVFSY